VEIRFLRVSLTGIVGKARRDNRKSAGSQQFQSNGVPYLNSRAGDQCGQPLQVSGLIALGEVELPTLHTQSPIKRVILSERSLTDEAAFWLIHGFTLS
jgi:hypothetical protein